MNRSGQMDSIKTIVKLLEAFEHPVAVEHVRAHAGLDIGDTLIGMHLREVAVPVRIRTKQIGDAHVVCARTRPLFRQHARDYGNRRKPGSRKRQQGSAGGTSAPFGGFKVTAYFSG